MATATKKPAPVPPHAEGGGTTSPTAPGVFFRAIDAVYRFLASLKLAVISLSTLAGTLAYATFFEKKHGTAAVQEWIYQSRGFAILLAFLGANILCAALIRFPWKRRQTGFVITHAGLLVLLGGSWYSVTTSDEGQVAALEGEVKQELVRTDYPVIRVRQVDPHGGDAPTREWELPFRPGTLPWGPGLPRPRSAFAVLTPSYWLEKGDADRPTEVLTRPGDPFQLVVKSHIPASVPAIRHEPDPSGMPMVKVRPLIKPPGAAEAGDIFENEDERWFTFDSRIYKTVRNLGPASLSFGYVDRPELVEDFLNPPPYVSPEGVARFRYADKAGKTRTHDWPLEGQAGKTITLPDSDFTVKMLDLVAFPAAQAGLGASLGASEIPMVEFEVARGAEPPVKHFAIAGLPMIPNVLPSAAARDAASKPLVAISYDPAPALEASGTGRFGVIEVLGASDGSLYHRVYGRPEAGKTGGVIRSKGRLEKGKQVVAFGGGSGAPMSLSFAVEEYYTAGVEKKIAEPIVLPTAQMGNGIAASLVEMTVKDASGKESTKEFYVRRSNTLDQAWQSEVFPNGEMYQLCYDADRKPLGFELKLIDFDRGFDPGTEQASRFQSDVELTDRQAGLVAKPHRIEMNEPLTHKGYTFYQSSYIREQDPRTGRETGRVQSVLQVGKNPGRSAIYLGCLLIVLGTFVQFYMRAGLFSDGGKREREKAVAKAEKRAGAGRTAPRADEDDVL